MTSPIDLLTRGLISGTGLPLLSGGLLVLRDTEGAGTDDLLAAAARIDAQLIFDAVDFLDGDLAIVDGDLAIENSMGSAILLALFTDARASLDELARFGGDDPRGWWGDVVSAFAGDAFGSKLWLLSREKETAETLARAKEYAQQALAFFLTDGIADAVNVTTLYPRRSVLGVVVEIVRARAPRERFAFVWELT